MRMPDLIDYVLLGNRVFRAWWDPTTGTLVRSNEWVLVAQCPTREAAAAAWCLMVHDLD